MCVEVQFALLILLFFKGLFANSRRYLIFAGVSSCLLQLFSSLSFAREFTPFHAWQFMIGMAAFYWNHDHKQVGKHVLITLLYIG